MESNFQKTIKGFSSQTIVTLVTGIIEIAVFSIMSRILTKKDFGYYAVLTSIIVIFQSISEAGIGSSVIQKKKANRDYINTAFTISIIFGIIFTIILILSAKPISTFIIDESLKIPLIILSSTIIPYSINSVTRAIMMRELKFMQFGMINLISYTIGSFIGIIYALNEGGYYSLIVSNISTVTILLGLSFYFSHYKPSLKINASEIKSIISYGGWLTLSRIIFTIYRQIDKFTLAKWTTVDSLGNFYRTRGFIDSVSTKLSGIFDITLFPILSDIQDMEKSIKSAFKKSFVLGGIAFTSLFLLFFFNAELIISIFLGNKWLDQSTVFRILSISMLFSIYMRLADSFIRSLAYVQFFFYTSILSCFLLIISIYIGINWGIEGVALAVVITNFLVFIIELIFITKKIGISLYKTLLEIFKALKFSIPLVLEGIIFLKYFNNSILSQIIFAIIFLLSFFIVFLFFPNLVGKIYKENIYPLFIKYLPKSFLKKYR